MSYLVAVPEILASSAGDVANLGAALSTANAAAATPTTTMLAAVGPVATADGSEATEAPAGPAGPAKEPATAVTGAPGTVVPHRRPGRVASQAAAPVECASAT
ncbi:hypothetical protein A4G28_26135 [Mycobacterium ostraviense]|uniref:PE domain-containing protein n=1 Tax=Mycobacterium ostraviense TaxID=2738409 RepID=A0A163WKV1_9MYCO|nr:PE domain-containing protein [Mycobacterium ostraviense]KZS58436.1 hypothetical protein A4G28_26135 [Mycobacterium ostraviense]